MVVLRDASTARAIRCHRRSTRPRTRRAPGWCRCSTVWPWPARSVISPGWPTAWSTFWSAPRGATARPIHPRPTWIASSPGRSSRSRSAPSGPDGFLRATDPLDEHARRAGVRQIGGPMTVVARHQIPVCSPRSPASRAPRASRRPRWAPPRRAGCRTGRRQPKVQLSRRRRDTAASAPPVGRSSRR
jgi:hypothetical protein